VAGAARRGRRLAAAQLLLHPADPQVHHRRARQPARPGDLRRRRDRGQLGGRPAARKTRQAARAGADAQTAVHRGRQRAARRPGRCRAARTAPRDVRPGLGDPARTPARARPPGPDRGDPVRLAVAAPRTPRSRGRHPVTDDDLSLRAARPAAPASDRRIVEAFAAQAAVALRQERLPPRRGRPSRSPRPTGCGPRCSPRSATTCAPRSPRPRPRSPACAARRRLRRRRPRRTAGHRRRVARPADRLVGNLLDMSRLQAGALACHPGRRARGDRPPRARRPRARRATGRRPHPGRPARGARRPRPAANGSWSTSSATRCATARRPPARCHRQHPRRPGRAARHRPRAGHPPRDRWERVFLPFQRLGDRDNTPASASAWRCPAASPRRWAAP
jgi:two-component system sensor histidine kinase KdpD